MLEIVEYYEQEGSPSVGDSFVSELRLFIEAIAERPESYSKEIVNIRRANLHRFPYNILFRILDEKTIKILR